jgi:hypothetical protein
MTTPLAILVPVSVRQRHTCERIAAMKENYTGEDDVNGKP